MNDQKNGQNWIEPAGEDDRCTLDPNKICDNCFRCLDGDTRAYAEIKIDRVLLYDEDGAQETCADDMHSGASYDKWARTPRIRVHPMTIRGYCGRHKADVPIESDAEEPERTED